MTLSRLYRTRHSSQGRQQFQNGQIFRPGTVVRDSGGRIIGGDPYPDNIIPRSEWSKNAPAFIKILSAAGPLDRRSAPDQP